MYFSNVGSLVNAPQRQNFTDEIMKTLHCMSWWSSMLDVEFYRLYNGLRARDLMPSLCRDFCDFHKSLPCFLPFFTVIFYCPSLIRSRVCGRVATRCVMEGLSIGYAKYWPAECLQFSLSHSKMQKNIITWWSLLQCEVQTSRYFINVNNNNITKNS